MNWMGIHFHIIVFFMHEITFLVLAYTLPMEAIFMHFSAI